jgi:hypothetical protein
MCPGLVGLYLGAFPSCDSLARIPLTDSVAGRGKYLVFRKTSNRQLFEGTAVLKALRQRNPPEKLDFSPQNLEIADRICGTYQYYGTFLL